MSEPLKKTLTDLTAAVRSHPELASVSFRATTVSPGPGFETRSRICDHHLVLDEPRDLGGANQGPNPVEIVLAALGSCQEIVYRAYATVLGLRIERVEVHAEGTLDIRGFLNLSDVPAGFQRITFATRIVSSEPEDRIRELVALVEKHCPVLDTLRRAVDVTGTVEQVASGRRACTA